MAAWSPDGRRLFYETLDHRVMAVDFRVVDGILRPGPPKLWADAQLADTGMGPGLEVAPDGRLLALVSPSGSRPPQSASNITLVLNFFSEVKRRTSQRLVRRNSHERGQAQVVRHRRTGCPAPNTSRATGGDSLVASGASAARLVRVIEAGVLQSTQKQIHPPTPFIRGS